MRVGWSVQALRDVERLYFFLTRVDPAAAEAVRESLKQAPRRLLDHPRIGYRLEAFDPREVRRLLVGTYEMRYEILPTGLIMLRVYHASESR
jgi:plasmid stabilization system protein ParE